MILDADMKIFDWKGETVVENQPTNMLVSALAAMGRSEMLPAVLALIGVDKQTDPDKPITLGSLLAVHIAAGIGLEVEQHPSCFALAAKFHEGGHVNLSNAESEMVRKAVEASPSPQGWVKGLVRFLLDPDSISESDRAEFDSLYPAPITQA